MTDILEKARNHVKDFHMPARAIAKLWEVDFNTVKTRLNKHNINPEIQKEEAKSSIAKYSFESIRKISKKYARFPEHYVTKQIHSFMNLKGGTGKTTLCFHIAAYLAALNFKVLCIDLDPQGQLSSFFGIDENLSMPTMKNVLVKNQPIEDVILKFQDIIGMDLIPGNLGLEMEIDLSSLISWENVLSRKIEHLKSDYDFIFIDTNPSFSRVNVNSLIAADAVNIVAETHPFSFHGLKLILQKITALSNDIGVDMTGKTRIIPNRFNASSETSKEVISSMMKEYKNILAEGYIRSSEFFVSSSREKRPILCTARKSSIAVEDISDLANEIIEQSLRKAHTRKS